MGNGYRPELAGEKIVILISLFERGGAERQAYLLARELRQRHSLDVEVWALTHPGSYAADFEAAGIPIRVLGFHPPDYQRVHLRDWPKLAWRLWRVVRQMKDRRVRVLLPFTTWPNVVAGVTYRLAGVRLCIWGERHCGGERVPGLEHFASRRYRRFVANSTAGVEFLAREMHVPRERISFVPNGVDDAMQGQSMDWRARLHLGAGQPLVVKVANFSNHKDHETLLRAWKCVQDAAWAEGERPFLALAGYQGSRYQACRDIVRETGLDSSVGFLGSIPDVAGLIQASDLAVFSSLHEGMPNGVLECMAAGKAILATDLPGIRDALGPGADKVLVRLGDADQFAGKMLALLSNKGRRDALGAANRDRAREEFSVERMAERHLHVIQECLGNGGDGVPTSVTAPVSMKLRT
jgi:glycosyltransferase involved in cell wall biosynthesis